MSGPSFLWWIRCGRLLDFKERPLSLKVNGPRSDGIRDRSSYQGVKRDSGRPKGPEWIVGNSEIEQLPGVKLFLRALCLCGELPSYITICFTCRVIGCCISSRSPLTRFSPYTQDSNSCASLANSGASRAYSNWSNLETM